MSYLKEFQYQINNRDFHKFFQLWEEYCTNDQADAAEFHELLKAIKDSEFAKLFGKFAETALPLWKCVEEEEDAYQILKQILDLQTTNSPILADTAFKALQQKFGDDSTFNERIRQVGLRARESFVGAISNYELLTHMNKGNFVYHTGGWGTGEVMDVSSVREQASVEFENVTGIKHLTFDNAFKTLTPLRHDHFLSRRFADPDLLEDQARKDPLEVLKALLQDLGPRTAAEIKEELCDLVIPEKDWSRWWQTARAKLKKDTMVECPTTLRAPFELRESEIPHEARLEQAIEDETNLDNLLQTSYSFARDLPQMLRKKEVKDSLKAKLVGLLEHEDLTQVQELQIYLFLETLLNHQVENRSAKDFIQGLEDVTEIIHAMDIIAFKKRALVLVREHCKDWAQIFTSLFLTVEQAQLRDYLLKELNHEETRDLLLKQLNALLKHSHNWPEVFLWYFQKLSKKSSSNLPFNDKEGQCHFLEALLILLNKLEGDAKQRDVVKKMYNILIGKRFAVIRAFIEGTSLEFIKEFLLLVSKCHTFKDHDKKNLRSLAQVVQPSLAPSKSRSAEQMKSGIVWTSQEGYVKTQERLKQIATVEVIENAREVEAARALGDLRENAEYKFAVEKRARLQGEMKQLSKLMNNARILTPDDIFANEVGVGSVIDLENSRGEHVSYTILGPWDTDPDKLVISYQSQLAQAMAGKKIGKQFTFRDEEYKIIGIKPFI